MDVAPWPLISLSLAVLATIVEGRPRITSAPIWGLVIVFSLVIVASAFNAQYPATSWEWMNLWVNWLLLILVVGAGTRSRLELFLTLVAFGLWNLKMTQFGVRAWFGAGFSFRASGASGGPGWFQNSGEFGIEMCVFLPLAIYFSIGLWPTLTKYKRIFLVGVVGSALISMVVTSSRGALVGAAAIGLWALLRSKQRMRAIPIITFVAIAIWVIVPAESKARFSEMGEDQTSVSRLTYWKHAIEITNDHPVLGIGYKNWIPYYRANYNPRGELPHNFLLECAAELGYLGVLVLLSLIGATFVENAKTRRICGQGGRAPDRFLYCIAHGLDGAMIGFIVSGSFVTVLFYPFLWMNIALVLALCGVRENRGRVTRRLAGHWPANKSPWRAGPIANHPDASVA